MLSFLLSLFTGIIPSIVKEITQERIAMANATTDQDKIAAEERIQALQAKRDVLIANAKDPWESLARFLLQAPIGILLWKLLVWDYSLGWGTTVIPNNAAIWYVVWAVLGYYFMTDLKGIFKTK